MDRHRQALVIVVSALLGVGAWAFVRPWLPRAELAESDFQANLIRLQTWSMEPPRSNVVVGSSIAGRLLPSTFRGTALDSLANLALDGSGPELGIRLLLGAGAVPPRVFVEVHRLGKPWHANDDTLLGVVHETGFALAGRLPALRADSRPTTLLYAWLKGRREPAGAVAAAGTTPSPAPAPARFPAADPGWEERFRGQVGELRRRGCEVVLLRLPVGRENPADPAAPGEADRLARALGVRLVDVNREAAKRGLGLAYSDGLHLTPASARAVGMLFAELAARPGTGR